MSGSLVPVRPSAGVSSPLARCASRNEAPLCPGRFWSINITSRSSLREIAMARSASSASNTSTGVSASERILSTNLRITGLSSSTSTRAGSSSGRSAGACGSARARPRRTAFTTRRPYNGPLARKSLAPRSRKRRETSSSSRAVETITGTSIPRSSSASITRAPSPSGRVTFRRTASGGASSNRSSACSRPSASTVAKPASSSGCLTRWRASALSSTIKIRVT